MLSQHHAVGLQTGCMVTVLDPVVEAARFPCVCPMALGYVLPCGNVTAGAWVHGCRQAEWEADRRGTEGLALRLFSGESHSSRFCLLSDQPRSCPDASNLPGLRLLRSRLRMCAASGLGLLRSLSRRRTFFWGLCLLCLSPCFCADLHGNRTRESCALWKQVRGQVMSSTLVLP